MFIKLLLREFATDNAWVKSGRVANCRKTIKEDKIDEDS